MARKIKIRCPRCGYIQQFHEDELVSELALKDDSGRVVDKSPRVVVDSNTLVQCQGCGGPVLCDEHNAEIV